jgi:predicted kinase
MIASMAARLLIVCGLPGAGKTTVARRIEQAGGGVRLSADEWMAALGIDLFDEAARARVEALQWELAQRLLVLGQDVVVEWGTWTRAERDALRRRARKLGAEVELRYLDAPFEVLWERVRRRGMEAQLGSRALTLADMRGYLDAFEPPDADEMARYDPPVDPTVE